MRLRPSRLGALVAALVLAGGALHAQPVAEPEARVGDELGWHIVQPGETLSVITQRYLGVSRLWRENHRLNPTIRDPDRLRIGQRLRVITKRDTPERSAEILQVANRVDQKPVASDWLPAQEGNRLRRDEALRTGRRSSSALGFEDGTELKVGETSLVLIRQIGQRLTGERQQTIEIDYGEADLAAAPQRAGSSEIEVIVGGATARPEPAQSGRIDSRLRKNDSGGAELMVYDGKSAVEAAGQSVNVGRGMGTAVRPGEAPSPPERLLPAPTVTAPTRGTRFGFSNPQFAWRPLATAASYTVEVCADPGCAQLVDRAAGLESTEWRPENLPAGVLFFRVRGKSANGLDGYPSPATRFEISVGMPDLEPPVIALQVTPPGRAASPSEIFLGPRGALRPMLHDDASGIQRLRYRWDQGAWRVWTTGAISAPAAGGVYALELEARDRAGRESNLALQVERLVQPPAPPLVRPGPIENPR